MTYKEEFIQFMANSGVLTFGEFTLKSGRLSPYFINAGIYKTGLQLSKLGNYYAECIMDNGIEVETLFGPAYKGIPLAISTAIALNNNYNLDVSYCFDRKEAKDHGEGGILVGKKLVDNEKVVLIDDVTTSGKVLQEVLPKIKSAAKIDITAMIITVDRVECGLKSDLSAVQEAYKEHGIKIYSIVNINDIISSIEKGIIDGKQYLTAMREYRKKYGVEQ